jgi:flagellar basal-body rod protein FlgB
MKILDSFFGPHSQNLAKALDRTTMRHGLLTNNLANINTPGYKRRDVEFGIALEQEMNSGLRGASSHEGEVKVTQGSMRLDGNSAVLEQEMMGIAETELRYQALTEMTSRYFRGLRDAIKEGRG